MIQTIISNIQLYKYFNKKLPTYLYLGYNDWKNIISESNYSNYIEIFYTYDIEQIGERSEKLFRDVVGKFGNILIYRLNNIEHALILSNKK